GDVAGADEHAPDGRIGEERAGRGLEPAPRAVAVAQPQLEHAGPPLVGRALLQDGAGPAQVLGVDQVGERRADLAGGGIAEELPARRADELQVPARSVMATTSIELSTSARRR